MSDEQTTHEAIPVSLRAAPRKLGPAGPAPVRPANSVRRTTTLDMTWPGGWNTDMHVQGTARDAFTRSAGDAPTTVDTAEMQVTAEATRQLTSVATTPQRDSTTHLVGCRGGGHLRAALQQHLPHDLADGTPLYLLLDDLSGATLIGGFAWSRWRNLWAEPERVAERPSMVDICIGFRPGSSAMDEQGRGRDIHQLQPVGTLVNADDPQGWHPLAELTGVSMRRARRIDVWVDGDTIHIDSAFQDSMGDPQHGRVAVHEYRLEATADLATQTLLTITPEPRVLPYDECPSAALTAQTMVGTALPQLRLQVLEHLARNNGCTHLNDAMRALADVPALLRHLAPAEA